MNQQHKIYTNSIFRLSWMPIFATVLLIGAQVMSAGEIQKNGSFGAAEMSFDGKIIRVSTGSVERRWEIVAGGLATVGLKDLRSGKEWGARHSTPTCDWMFDGLEDGTLVSLTAAQDDDDKFTAPYLKVRAEFAYQAGNIAYVVWAYPGAAGLRTQVEIKAAGDEKGSPVLPAEPPASKKNMVFFNHDRTDKLSFAAPFKKVRAFGLLQGDATGTSILKEEVLPWANTTIDWANGIMAEGEGGGVMTIKESNKHTAIGQDQNRLTGAFTIADNRLEMSGCGYSPDMVKDNFLPCWANWIILYQGDSDQADLALKAFDRVRYPIESDRDIFMMANTWGSEGQTARCLHAAREENVLREIESVADLGIDVLQIDDGWQKKDWTPAANSTEAERSERLKEFGVFAIYPQGFKNVRQKAEKMDVTLGLWAAVKIPLDKLKSNYDQGGFKKFKLDFAFYRTKAEADGILNKARELIKYSGYAANVNWDATGRGARMGYFFGREVGNIYLVNRKTIRGPGPKRGDYNPDKILRLAWQLAKYANLNQFQVTIGNVDRIPEGAPPYAYGHQYAVGVALMSSPIFFQETHYYKPEARRQVKSVLEPYREHRKEMYTGYVFPIGDEPDNKSWTGFQNYIPESQFGYLTVFREAENEQDSHEFTLKFLKDKEIRLTNLLTGETKTTAIDAVGKLNISMDKPAQFRFYRYEIL